MGRIDALCLQAWFAESNYVLQHILEVLKGIIWHAHAAQGAGIV
jgi:hypothetical protein